MKNAILAATLLGFGLCSGTAIALPVNGTGNVTPNVIMGSGIGNGSWTGVNENGIEVALRAKVRFPSPADVFNYDGDHTYTFFSPASLPTNRSVFNFEYSINIDSDDTTGFVFGDLTYLFEFDTDPSAGVAFSSIDPIHDKNDNAYGNNTTAQSGGVAGPADDSDTDVNVAQNSLNLGFDAFSTDPDARGTYTFRLSVFDPNQGGALLAQTSIDVVVDIPEPGVLAMFGTGLAMMGFIGWRRRNGQTA